jgi:hypothetical protein
MQNKDTRRSAVSLLKLFIVIVFVHMSYLTIAGDCNPYIKQLSNGNVVFAISFTYEPAYVEVFIKKDGLQFIAKDITASKAANANSTFTYSYTVLASTFVEGNSIEARFYSHVNGIQIFTPGPIEQEWSEKFIYGTINCEVYVSVNGSNSNPGTTLKPVKSIAKGIELAKKYEANQVRVAEGLYSIQSEIVLANGISLLGGFSSDFTKRDVTFTKLKTTIKAPHAGTQFAGPRVVKAEGITEKTIVEGFEITGGVIHGAGGGIYINNSSVQLEIRSNRIVGNYATYTTGRGGNIAVVNSSPLIYDNIIINGFAPFNDYGSDIYISGTYQSNKSHIFHNVITKPSSVINAIDPVTGEPSSNFNNNYYVGQVVYVSPNGADYNSGEINDPLKTIAKGIAVAKIVNGFEVRVSEGTYHEGDIAIENGISLHGGYSSNFTQRDTTLANYVTIIKGTNGGTQASGPRILYAENIDRKTVIEGFVLTNGVTHSYGGGIFVTNSSSNLEIKNNKIIKNYATYSGGRGGNIAMVNSAAKVYNNNITDGFSGLVEYGRDIFITGAYCSNTCASPLKSEIFNNIFTAPEAVVGSSDANFYNNSYLQNAPSTQANEAFVDVKVFPNPFAEKICIATTLPKETYTSLVIYNSKGEVVEVLADKFMQAGHHTFEWNGVQNNAGLYHYKLVLGDKVKSALIYKH